MSFFGRSEEAQESSEGIHVCQPVDLSQSVGETNVTPVSTPQDPMTPRVSHDDTHPEWGRSNENVPDVACDGYASVSDLTTSLDTESHTRNTGVSNGYWVQPLETRVVSMEHGANSMDVAALSEDTSQVHRRSLATRHATALALHSDAMEPSLDSIRRLPTTPLRPSGHASSASTSSWPWDGHVPVANAVLVSREQLAAEETTRYHTRYDIHSPLPIESPNESRRSSTSESLREDHTDGPSRSKDDDSITASRHSERRFWMTVIVLATFFNSLLAGGIVVGGFCAAGKCTRRGGGPTIGSAHSSGNGAPVTHTPTIPPLVTPHLSRVPSRSPSRRFDGKGASRRPVVPTISLQPSQSPYPTINVPSLVVTRFPTPPFVFPTISEPPRAPVPRSPAVFVAQTPVTVQPTVSTHDATTRPTSAKWFDVPPAILVATIMGAEVLIVAGLFVYWRHWKQQELENA